MSVLAAIAVLAILIVVHELGHFAAARLQGIYANRFSIGFGPILWKYQGSQTEYAIRAFPLGGFVGFPDEDPDSTIPRDDPNLLSNRPLLDRAIVMSAGVIANLIFAYFVLVLQLGTVGALEAPNPGVMVEMLPARVEAVNSPASDVGFKAGDEIFLNSQTDYALNPQQTTATLLAQTTSNQPVGVKVKREVEPGKFEIIDLNLPPNTGKDATSASIRLTPTAAIKSGLKPGDVILAVNGQTLGRAPREEGTLRRLIAESPGTPLQLTIARDNQQLKLTTTPEATSINGGSEIGKIGASLAPNGTLKHYPVSGLAIFGRAADEFQQIVNDTFAGFSQLIHKFSQTANQVAGPVAIVAAGARIAQSDAANLYYFAALISINLAIINILPLPALDGGHLVFLLLEGLRGKPLPTKIQEGVMQTGLMLLLGLGIFLILRDTANLIGQ